MKNPYIDDEPGETQACLYVEQYMLMICSVPLLKFALAAVVNYTVE